jgi:hypothetical protein
MRLLISLVFLSALINGRSQLYTDTNFTNLELIEKIAGNGVYIQNVNYTGANFARAYFDGSSTNIGLDSGVVITTGTAVDSMLNILSYNNGPHGPNNDNGSGMDNNYPGNQLYTDLGGEDSYNTAFFEINFIPNGDSLYLKYVWGSEEYPEYVCAYFNDVFGFFLSGPNPSGGNYVDFNIPLIPGTSIPVSINSVNNGSVGSNGDISNCTPQELSNSALYVDNIGGQTIQYDSFTVPIIGSVEVQCGQLYTIIIGVSDIGDGVFDSGVFIESGSFRSNGATIISSNSNGIQIPNSILVDSTTLQDSLYQDIYLVNNTTDSMIFSLERGITENLFNWDDHLCLSDTCFDISGQPNWNSQGFFNEKIPPSDSILFRPVVFPNQQHGCATTEYRVIDSCGYVTSEFQIVWHNGDGPCDLSFEEIKISDRIKIFPNPTNTELKVSFPADIDINYYTIYGLDGRLVKKEDFSPNIDVSEIAAGNYLIVLNTKDNQQVTKKFLVYH